MTVSEALFAHNVNHFQSFGTSLGIIIIFFFVPVVPSVPELFSLLLYIISSGVWQTQTIYESATEVQPLDSALLETSWNNHSIVQAPQNSLWWQMCVLEPAQGSRRSSY